MDTNQTIIFIYTTEQIEEENKPIPMEGAAMMYCFSQLKFMCGLQINKQHDIISLTQHFCQYYEVNNSVLPRKAITLLSKP